MYSRRRLSVLLLALMSLSFATSLQAQKNPPNKKEGDVDKVSPAVPRKGEETEPAPPAGKMPAASPSDPLASGTFSGLALRSIGPALISGRVVAFAVNPHNRAEYYVAAASGGVWKTKNSGTSWTPVFENEGSFSIGTVVLDPNDSNVVWVGTGESNSQRSVSYGDGVYRSDDGGKSWKNLGLKHSEHIGRIVIDPKDSDTVYVAAEGPLWGPNGDRGLYKTTDGGKNWKKVLNISENTGVGDVAMDPTDPDTLYAAAYQRQRRVWTLIDGGPESAIYKSKDGGETWVKAKTGLPTEDLGRIGLAISPVDHNVVYATIEAANKKGGIFRSTDRGGTWEKRNDYDTTAMYYSQIVADPHSKDRIYVPNFLIQVSDDGGKTLRNLGEKFKHVDNHVIWIDPNDTDYYLVGCDGGVYESFDRGENWAYKANLPLGQFYDVAVDNATPFYNVYGGTQDNFSLGGPSRTMSASGITNGDWFVTQGGDGFRTQVDPDDPNTVYAEYQYGGLTRYDRRTGQNTGIQPQEGKGEQSYRWNWDSPLLISPFAHARLYFAANKLFRSDDRGNTWRAISGDLTRQIDRNKLPIMGRIWGPDAVAKNASTSFYGNIVALSESPLKEGLIFVGTDDGLLQITSDGGASWNKVEKFPGVPDKTYVSRLAGSHHSPDVVYAAFDNHKSSDFKPYLLKSRDQGRSWVSIAGNLPVNGPVLGFAEDPVNPNLLFAGTEFGLFFTLDGDKTAGATKWIQLKGNLPTIPVRDIVIHPRQNDLVMATFGRGFYILDDMTPLRQITAQSLQSEGVLFTPKDALMYVETRRLGGSRKSFQGQTFFTSDNPSYGAVFTYYLKKKYMSQKEQRQEQEKTAVKNNSAPPYPSNEELRAEAEEEGPALFLTIADSEGKPVRRLSVANKTGMNRVAWDLRYPAPVAGTPRDESADDDESDVPRGGALVTRGKYTAFLSKKINGVWSDLTPLVSFNVTVDGESAMNTQERADQAAFQRKVANLYRSLEGAAAVASDLGKKLAAIKLALRDTPNAPAQLMNDAETMTKQNRVIMRNLHGDDFLAVRNENVPPGTEGRVRTILSNERFSLSAPTQTDRTNYEIAATEYAQELAGLRTLVQIDLPKLEQGLENAGAPWTPGRMPTWNESK